MLKKSLFARKIQSLSSTRSIENYYKFLINSNNSPIFQFMSNIEFKEELLIILFCNLKIKKSKILFPKIIIDYI